MKVLFYLLTLVLLAGCAAPISHAAASPDIAAIVDDATYPRLWTCPAARSCGYSQTDGPGCEKVRGTVYYICTERYIGERASDRLPHPVLGNIMDECYNVPEPQRLLPAGASEATMLRARLSEACYELMDYKHRLANAEQGRPPE